MNDFTAHSPTTPNQPVAVVTGGNSGLGYQTAGALARQGYRVVLACRDTLKGEAAVQTLRAANPKADIQVSSLDLACFTSVQNFSLGFQSQYTRLDRLINNAGIMAVPHALTKEGHESQYAVNHLGHFLLTQQIMALLKHTPGARVVSVTSLAARMAKPHQLLDPPRRYDKWKSYSLSKLANLMFGLELHYLMQRNGLDAKSLLAHPGFSQTNLQSRLLNSKKISERITGKALLGLCQPADQGALPIIQAALSDTVQSGDFYGPSGKFQIKGPPRKIPIPAATFDSRLRSAFWALSEQQTHSSYTTALKT
ncbi:SDR family NAD(P)-dependent oxidoreductase [uncultured Alcanivorax sp.]|jgi:protochlorophyllide reductase|uniref:SDR family NAD(P)-dependent oxidoreductase n=1 Tax=uncultured Alcanivorax sp. TaxID=191215 RepID=UPI0026210530|nr:SDR family NAD(P)-dependent oxidoreductase [uncultured Alcanivorax sp.]